MIDRGIPYPVPPDLAPPEALRQRIRASLDSARGSRMPTRARILAALVAVPCLAAVVLALASQVVYRRPMFRLDFGVSPLLPLASVSLVGLTSVATFIALRRGRSGLGSPVAGLCALAAIVTPIYAALSLWSPSRSDAVRALADGLSPWGLPCLGVALVVGGLVLGAFLFALGHAVPAAARIRGAALGSAAGLWAGLTVFLFCPSGDPQHVLVGHVLPIVLLTLAGASVSARRLRS